MNYADLNKKILPKVMVAVTTINNPEIVPEVRQRNQEILFREVGNNVYNKVYEMNAFDFEIEGTKGDGMDDRFYGMAKVAADSVSTGNSHLEEQVQAYLDNTAGQAQMHAFRNAKEMGKRPKVTRIAVGKTCDWCAKMAGTYTDPSPEVFRRHDGCNCEIRSEGFRTRNGTVNNYKKAAPAFDDPKVVERAFEIDRVKVMGLKERDEYVKNYLAKASPVVADMAKDWDFTLQFQTWDRLTWEPGADESLIEKYVTDFRRGDKFPPAIALNFTRTTPDGMTTNNFTIIDGRHRIEAMKRLGAKGIPVLVGDLKGRFDLTSLGL